MGARWMGFPVVTPTSQGRQPPRRHCAGISCAIVDFSSDPPISQGGHVLLKELTVMPVAEGLSATGAPSRHGGNWIRRPSTGPGTLLLRTRRSYGKEASPSGGR